MEQKNQKYVFYLLTETGKNAYINFIRNLTPQIAIAAFWIFTLVRIKDIPFELKTSAIWFITVVSILIYIYLFYVNFEALMTPARNKYKDAVKKHPDYKPCPINSRIKGKSIYFLNTCWIIVKCERNVGKDVLITFLFFILPNVIVLIAASSMATQLYKAFMGG